MHLKSSVLDFMLGKPTSEFEDVFSAAFTPQEIQELAPWWTPEQRIRVWIKDHDAVVFLETNIWKMVEFLENERNTDSLVIALDGDTIVDYQFFANMAY